MPTISPFLRPVGIAAGVLGSVQAITWGVLSILGILVYTEAIDRKSPEIVSDKFLYALVFTYFNRNVRNMSDMIYFLLRYFTRANIMTPDDVVVWTSIYLVTSVIWLVISGLLLYDFCRSKFNYKIIIGWVAVSAGVAVIDFAGTMAFGVEYGKLQNEIGNIKYSILYRTEVLQAPLFMMTMCARGFILWIMNVGLVMYLGAAAIKLFKMGKELQTIQKQYQKAEGKLTELENKFQAS